MIIECTDCKDKRFYKGYVCIHCNGTKKRPARQEELEAELATAKLALQVQSETIASLRQENRKLCFALGKIVERIPLYITNNTPFQPILSDIHEIAVKALPVVTPQAEQESEAPKDTIELVGEISRIQQRITSGYEIIGQFWIQAREGHRVTALPRTWQAYKDALHEAVDTEAHMVLITTRDTSRGYTEYFLESIKGVQAYEESESGE